MYIKDDGSIGYRCPAEPEQVYVSKGGDPASTIGRKCLCNALIANVGMPQLRADGRIELPLVTLGDDVEGIGRFCRGDDPAFTAADVINVLLA